MGIKALAIASILVAGAAAADDRTVYILGPGVAPPNAPPVYAPGDMTPDPYNTSGAAVHGPGYLPETVPWTTKLVIRRNGRFDVFVTPNITPYRYALGSAARVAAGHCGGRPGAPVAEIDVASRYSRLDLESWGFSGHCR